jgi:hypothetical protein
VTIASFESALRQCRRLAQLDQHRHQVTQRGRHMREDRGLVAERAIEAGEPLVDRGEIGREFARGNAADAGHILFRTSGHQDPANRR